MSDPYDTGPYFSEINPFGAIMRYLNAPPRRDEMLRSGDTLTRLNDRLRTEGGRPSGKPGAPSIPQEMLSGVLTALQGIRAGPSMTRMPGPIGMQLHGEPVSPTGHMVSRWIRTGPESEQHQFWNVYRPEDVQSMFASRPNFNQNVPSNAPASEIGELIRDHFAHGQQLRPNTPISSAAIRFRTPDGQTHIVTGRNHLEAMDRAESQFGQGIDYESDGGFLDAQGNYLTRQQAALQSMRARQLRRPQLGSTQGLTSEDLNGETIRRNPNLDYGDKSGPSLGQLQNARNRINEARDTLGNMANELMAKPKETWTEHDHQLAGQIISALEEVDRHHQSLINTTTLMMGEHRVHSSPYIDRQLLGGRHPLEFLNQENISGGRFTGDIGGTSRFNRLGRELPPGTRPR